MNVQRATILGVALAVFFFLAVVFIVLPAGWNLLPLILMGLVLSALPAVWRETRSSPAGPSPADEPEAPTGARRAVQRRYEREPQRKLAGRLNRSFGPIAAGVVIDLVDAATFGPIGLVLGLPLGGLAGYWMGRAMGMRARAAAWCALAAGIYCTIPGTEFLPLATIIGAYSRFREDGPEPTRARRGQARRARAAPGTSRRKRAIGAAVPDTLPPAEKPGTPDGRAEP